MADTSAWLVEEVLARVATRQWVLSVPHGLRYLFARDPAALGAALAVVYRALEGWLVARAGVRRGAGAAGAITLIQRFGSALNLNVHLHLLLPAGVYVAGPAGPEFRRVAPPTAAELEQLVARIAKRLGRQLERRGVLVRDTDGSRGRPVRLLASLRALEFEPGATVPHRP